MTAKTIRVYVIGEDDPWDDSEWVVAEVRWWCETHDQRWMGGSLPIPGETCGLAPGPCVPGRVGVFPLPEGTEL